MGTKKKNHLILWKGITLFLGSNPKPISEHKHPILQLIIGANEPFLSKSDSGDWVEKNALLIAANQSHECDAQGKLIFTLGIEQESTLGEWIKHKYLQSNTSVDFPKSELDFFDLDKVERLVEKESWNELYAYIEMLFAFELGVINSSKQDERIMRVKNHISTHIDSKIDTKSLMEVAHLSESRLLHLFKHEMGLPIRNYILWHRLQTAVKSILTGSSLTVAAHQSGFSDQAHMTRTCVKTIGIAPSLITQNSKFIQASFP